MSMIGSSGGPADVPLNFTGLASGLNTNEIIAALLSVERQPVAIMTDEQTTLQAQQQQLQSIQASLRQLAFSAAELVSPALFHASQTVTSSNPSQVSATVAGGAGVGGYQVEVAQLANSAQRTFTFKSPASEDTITIDGHPVSVAANATVEALVDSINSNSSLTVYAAAVNGETVVLSNRVSGATEPGFIAVSDPGGTLTEQAGLAKEGRDAQYTVDGRAGSSSSNTVTGAIAGVTLSLNALTTATGPVTIDVGAPAPNAEAIASKVQAFVSLYNSTIASIQAQLQTKRPAAARTSAELGTGTLFGDMDLSRLLDGMRQTVYSPIGGLPAEMSSLSDLGISTGAPAGASAVSQTSVEGRLTLDGAKLAEAIKHDPAGVQQLLEQWAQSFQGIVNAAAEPGGTLQSRIEGDGTQVAYIGRQIAAMNEALARRQEALQAQFAQLEAVISANKSQSAWLTAQATATVLG